MATLIQMPSPTEHIPVLAPELVALADPEPGELAVDCTFGAGGHARLVADRLGPTGRLIAIDRDPAAAERFRALEPELGCETRFVAGEYSEALRALAAEGVRADVVLLDLGVSSMQLDVAERGFSYAYDAPLDMRMDPGQELSALEVVNEWPAERLASVIRELGEERHARAIADGIVRRRPLARTGELVDAIRDVGPARLPVRARASGEEDLPGDPDRRQRRARRARRRAAGGLGAARRRAAGWPRSRSTRSRTAASSASSPTSRRAASARPSSRSAPAATSPRRSSLARRAVKPSEDEAERNPRSRSARLRVARKLPVAGSGGGSDENPRR